MKTIKLTPIQRDKTRNLITINGMKPKAAVQLIRKRSARAVHTVQHHGNVSRVQPFTLTF